MRIQELERKTGLERPSIRFYEKEGLLNPRRLDNGYRDYSEADVELLKKIKLLRQLGTSIEKIRNLQQGSEDLHHVVAKLMGDHSSQIQEHRRCRAVCEAIRSDGAAFPTLNADHYLKLMREIRVDEHPLDRTDFQEHLPKEIHPWRRFFARFLDHGLWMSLVCFFYIVVMRIRPLPGDFWRAFITVFGMALFIPAEALMLSRFGTTPGKFALGIRIESIQGGNLTWQEALRRSCNVYVQGTGCCIPLLEPAIMFARYCKMTGRVARGFILAGPQDLDWDEETEIIYECGSRKRFLTVVLTISLTLGICLATTLDGIRPRYRGNQLTISQFAENYNTYLSWTEEDIPVYDRLQSDGSFRSIPSNTAVVDMNDSRQDHRIQFDYKLEGEYLQSVSITQDWNDVFYLAPLTVHPWRVSTSLLMAQKGCGIREMIEFANLYQSYLDAKCASFQYKNLLIEWTITTELPMNEGVIRHQADGDSESVTAEMYFKITIQK